MSVNIYSYDQSSRLFVNQSLDYANIRLALVEGYVFSTTHTTWNDTAGFEVSGHGWTLTGEILVNASVTTINTNEAMFDADDIIVIASGGDIGPASGAVIYDATNSKLLAYVDFGQELTAQVGKDFRVVFATAGVFTWSVVV